MANLLQKIYNFARNRSSAFKYTVSSCVLKWILRQILFQLSVAVSQITPQNSGLKHHLLFLMNVYSWRGSSVVVCLCSTWLAGMAWLVPENPRHFFFYIFHSSAAVAGMVGQWLGFFLFLQVVSHHPNFKLLKHGIQIPRQ